MTTVQLYKNKISTQFQHNNNSTNFQLIKYDCTWKPQPAWETLGCLKNILPKNYEHIQSKLTRLVTDCMADGFLNGAPHSNTQQASNRLNWGTFSNTPVPKVTSKTLVVCGMPPNNGHEFLGSWVPYVLAVGHWPHLEKLLRRNFWILSTWG